MKKITAVGLFISLYVNCWSQSRSLLIRHDTTLLKAEECQWLLQKAAAGEAADRSVSSIIIDAIVAGKIKATDLVTGEIIPADKFLTWQQSSDTMMVWDEKLQKDAFKIIQRTINPESLTRIRIYHDWVLNNSSGKLEVVINRVDLMRNIFSPTGTLRGITPFCRLE